MLEWYDTYVSLLRRLRRRKKPCVLHGLDSTSLVCLVCGAVPARRKRVERALLKVDIYITCAHVTCTHVQNTRCGVQQRATCDPQPDARIRRHAAIAHAPSPIPSSASGRVQSVDRRVTRVHTALYLPLIAPRPILIECNSHRVARLIAKANPTAPPFRRTTTACRGRDECERGAPTEATYTTSRGQPPREAPSLSHAASPRSAPARAAPAPWCTGRRPPARARRPHPAPPPPAKAEACPRSPPL
eukprot:3794910-Prymnesium_polylepis.1